MKICHLLPQLEPGGAEILLIHLANEQVKNHTVTIYTFMNDNISLVNQLSPNIHYKNYSNILLAIISIVRSLKKYDVIHGHLIYSSIILNILYIFKSLLRINTKIVETNHSTGMPLPLLTKITFKISSYLRDKYFLVTEDEYFSNKKSVVIPNGLNLENVHKSLNYSNICIGTVSRVVPERLPYKLAEVFEKLSDNLNINRIIWIGSGSLLEEIKEKYSRKIYFLGKQTDIKKYLKEIDIFISINTQSKTGIASFEAISNGIPVFSIQAQPNYDGSNDWIISSDNLNELVNIILEKVELRKLEEYAAIQAKVIKEEYHIRTCSERYLSNY